jgi:hypothetical protein
MSELPAAQKLRKRIAMMEDEMMQFRASMTVVLAELYQTVHELERQQRWNKHYAQDTIEHLKRIRDCMVVHFNESEFKTLCFDLGVRYDDLLGETISDKARELVLHMNRLGRCDELIAYCKRKRPKANFML